MSIQKANKDQILKKDDSRAVSNEKKILRLAKIRVDCSFLEARDASIGGRPTYLNPSCFGISICLEDMEGAPRDR